MRRTRREAGGGDESEEIDLNLSVVKGNTEERWRMVCSVALLVMFVS